MDRTFDGLLRMDSLCTSLVLISKSEGRNLVFLYYIPIGNFVL